MAVQTPCPFCAIQCGLTIDLSASAARPIPNDPIGAGHICRKGRVSQELLDHPLRVKAPLHRINGQWQAESWDTALDQATEELKSIQQRYGSNSIYVYGSGALTNEAAYLTGKLARLGIGTQEIDYNGRFCMASAARAYVQQFGLDRPTTVIDDINFSDVLLIAGSNLADAHPMILPKIQRARKRGAKIIVVDPRKTPMSRVADWHLAIRPGTDSYLAWALLSTVIEEDLINQQFISEWTENFTQVEEMSLSYRPELVAPLIDIDAETIRTVARLFARGPRSMFLHGRGIEQYHNGRQTVSSFLNLVIATGQVGRIGTGAIMLTGQANGQGGREMGQKLDQLPGGRSIEDPHDRAHVAALWGVEPEKLPHKGNYSASEVFDAITDGSIRAMIVIGANPAISAPNTARVRHALSQLETLIVLDPLHTETAQSAHWIFPSGGFGVSEGTITNIEARVIPVRSFEVPSEHAKPDWWVISQLGQRLSHSDQFQYSSVNEIFNEIRWATRGAAADYFGMSRQAIEAGEKFYWPCPLPGTHGTQRLYSQKFSRPRGRAQFLVDPPRAPLDTVSSQHPWHLITGRTWSHYNSGIQTQGIEALNKHSTQFMNIHPLTAQHLNICDNGPVRITNHRGQLEAIAHFDSSLRKDTIFVSMHGADANPNHLIASDLLSEVKMPEFKHTTVSIVPISPQIVLEEDGHGILSYHD